MPRRVTRSCGRSGCRHARHALAREMLERLPGRGFMKSPAATVGERWVER
jgi:hypothetical protein